MVIWIIGLSGSGKTTLGTEMFKILKKSDNKWIFLDGDMVRTVLGEDLGHTIDDRRKNANRITNLCKMLDSQGMNVLACVLSIFHDNQKNNREIFSSYKEIFIDVDFDKLLKRDNKNLYKQALKGEMKNVVGVDIEFPKPINPDVVINNNEDQVDFTKLAYEVINELNIELLDEYEYSCIDRLKYPHKYQYTPFESTRLLEKYVESRENAIKVLKTDIDKLIKSNNQQLEKIPLNIGLNRAIYYGINEINTSIDKNLNKNELVTEEFLRDFLRELLQDELISSNEHMNKLLLLIKKFEVSKKLYSKYNSDTYKKESNEYDLILNYLLFSNVLSRVFYLEENKYRKYIIFNTLLKTNDLIISILQKVVTLGEKLLAYFALKEELNIYSALKGEHI